MAVGVSPLHFHHFLFALLGRHEMNRAGLWVSAAPSHVRRQVLANRCLVTWKAGTGVIVDPRSRDPEKH